MLERYFLKPQTVDRILACWLGSRIESYATILADRGYSARTILRRVPILVDFARFTEAKGVGHVEPAFRLVEDFIADWLSRRRAGRPGDVIQIDRNLVRVTVRQFFSLVITESEYLRARAPLINPFVGQLPGFFEYLGAERGLRASSIHHYQHY